MENFNQLLNQYIQRLGISDAELARTISVSRQTIFRWREGATARPRHREDVLAIAKKLRLAPEERDKLLLAAGFRPEEVEHFSDVEAEAEEQVSVATLTEAGEQSPISQPSIFQSKIQNSNPVLSATKVSKIAMVVGSVLLIVIGAWWINQGQTDFGLKRTPVVSHTVTPVSSLSNIDPAATGETLVLVTHFANYAGSQIGYNVAGRLTEALQREVDDTRLQNIRVAIWPEEIGKRDLALQTGQEISATLVIYGEYDVGRVVVKMAYPADQNVFIDPAFQRYAADLQDLSATINSDLPQQVRSLALMALGQIYLRQGETERARLILVQARDNLKGDTTVDEKTWGILNFYLGVAYQHSAPPDRDGAIMAYSKAIDAWPRMISARLNRGAVYEARKQPGDLQRALEDAEVVVTIAPDWAPGYNNRASIRINIGGTENLDLALIDLEKALELKPDLPEAYVNQSHIYLRQGMLMEKAALPLNKVLELRPGYGPAHNLLCWGYALEQQPEVAMPYCQQAVNSDPSIATFRDSRGVAYALLKDYPAAIADFKAYVAWLEEQPGDMWHKELAQRLTWIDTLEAGENPFTSEVLTELRGEFGK